MAMIVGIVVDALCHPKCSLNVRFDCNGDVVLSEEGGVKEICTLSISELPYLIEMLQLMLPVQLTKVDTKQHTTKKD